MTKTILAYEAHAQYLNSEFEHHIERTTTKEEAKNIIETSFKKIYKGKEWKFTIYRVEQHLIQVLT